MRSSACEEQIESRSLHSSSCLLCCQSALRSKESVRSRSKPTPPPPSPPLGFISSSQGKERAAAMWVEILCGLVVYKIIQRVFFAGGDDASYLADLDSSHSDLCFAVASRFHSFPHSDSLWTRETHPTDPTVGSDSPFQAREALRRSMLRRSPHPRPRRRRAPAYRRCPRYQEVSLSCHFANFQPRQLECFFVPFKKLSGAKICAAINWVYCLEITEIMYCRTMKLVPKNCRVPDLLVLLFFSSAQSHSFFER